MRRGHDRPTGRHGGTADSGMDDPRTAGAHSSGYPEEYQQSGQYTQAQGRGGEGYPSETVDYGRGGTGQAYPSERAPAEGRRAGARAYGERGVSGREAEPRGYYLMAAALLILSGLVTFFSGIVGVIHGAFYHSVTNYPFYYSPRSRGITELIIGAVVFMVGACLLLGMHWARNAAIVIAVVSAIFNFMFLFIYPFWTIIVIALDVFIIWALTHHDDDRRREYV
jgi:hypothetical protein